MSKTFQRISKIIATFFYVGHIPFAPGTAGTLAAMAVLLALNPDIRAQIGIVVAGFIVGVITSHSAEKSFGVKDCGTIVIDEVIGFFAAMAFLPITPGYLLAAFFLFRFFDIVKPQPIRLIQDKVHGGLGIMLDDLLAGIVTNLILQAWRIA